MTTEITNVEVMQPTAVEAMERANIDVQIATAHKYPRSMERFQKTAMTMITQDEETAASCIYSRPVGDGKYAEGMSIRMAEIVASGFGNLRVGSMLVEQSERQVKARGFAHDLESNFAATSEVVESTVDKYGKPYSERMRIVVAKACLAKARRDATFQVVPRALCKALEDAARKTAIGDAATLEKRRGAVLDWISKLGIDVSRVFSALKIQGTADLGLKELEILTGIKTAIKEGDTSVEEAFPNTITMPVVKDSSKKPKQEDKKDPPETQAPEAAEKTEKSGNTGVIEEVTRENGTNKTTGKPWIKYVVTIAGTKHSTFSEELGKQAEALMGRTVMFELSQKGKFTNLASIALVADAAAEVKNDDDKRAKLIAEIKELEGKAKASTLQKALHAVGVNFTEGESWEQLPDDKLATLATILKG